MCIICAAIFFLAPEAKSQQKCIKVSNSSKTISLENEAPEQVIVCAGQPFSLQSCSELDEVLFEVEGDERRFNPQEEIRVNIAGTYSITQLIGNETGGQKVEFEDALTVVEATPVVFDAFSCENKSIYIQTEDSGFSKFLLDFGDGNTLITDESELTYTYSSSGDFTITVNRIGDNLIHSCFENKKSISVKETIPLPKIHYLERTSLQGFEVKLEVNKDQNASLQVFENKGITNVLSNIEIDTLEKDLLRITTSVNKPSDILFFEISEQSFCQSSTARKSNILQSLYLSTTENNEGTQVFSWNKYQLNDFEKYELVGKSTESQTVANYSISSVSDTSLVLEETFCEDTVNFFVLAITEQGFYSRSNSVLVQKKETSENFDAIESLGSTFDEENNLTIAWELKTNESKSILVENCEELLADIPTNNRNGIYTVQNLDSSQKCCFNISSVDFCNKTSKPKKTCPIYLDFSESDNQISLFWTPYDSTNNLSYQVEVAPNNNDYRLLELSNTTENRLTLEKDVLFSYSRARVRTQNSNNELVYSNFIDLDQIVLAIIPTGFTPNGDGLNDFLKIYTKNINSYELIVLNIWEEKVFVGKSDKKYWNGIYRGKKVPSGTYLWIFRGVAKNGKILKKQGAVQVIY